MVEKKKNFFPNCVHCHYHDFDYGLFSFYTCDKYEDREDIQFDTVACDDFEEEEGRKEFFKQVI